MAHSMTSPIHTVCIVLCNKVAMIFFFHNEKYADILCILFFALLTL